MIKNKLYTKHLAAISILGEKIYDTLDNLPGHSGDETMEETEIRYILDSLAEKLTETKIAIEYFSKSVKEGYLRENSDGKFEIDFDCGETSYPLSCGSSLEVYLKKDVEEDIEQRWYVGRVEHTKDKGYYFYGANKPSLYNNMKVRVRE
ncbi:DUF5348 domain-containing protein [Clostridium pasteurianum]|uniref:DUF5348 domain-containing protein n=1 Tax=Clostridium pasteurianum TaxID=1501 RepID=UPI002260A274|nr:DUF5348 domain-containing protein [Clostridium pasteurianum]UZW13229.1 DUF5348 domain-containing protein [Clostridium pasteurianum]